MAMGIRGREMWVGLLALSACGGGGQGDWVVPTPAAEDVGARIRIVGIVRHYGLEGGFYAIRGSDSVTYDPTNLPPGFWQDGLPVEADVRRRDDLMGTHQVGPLVQLERIRKTGEAPAGARAPAPAPPAGAPPSLWGTAWVLEDLSGMGVVGTAPATLEFTAPDRAFGKGTCNRFSGVVTVTREMLRFGPLLSTKMACVDDAANAQESKYLSALEKAERFAVEGNTLRIFVRGTAAPLRFTRAAKP